MDCPEWEEARHGLELYSIEGLVTSIQRLVKGRSEKMEEERKRNSRKRKD